MRWEDWQALEPPEGMCDAFRRYIKDQVRRNRLLGGAEQLDEQDLVHCLRNAVDDWNETPPLVDNATFETHPSVRLLFLFAMVEAHRMMGQVQTANQLTYTDGGINVAVSDKTALHQSWLNGALSEYEQKKRMWKTSANLERAYGQTWSEYANLGFRSGLD